MTISLSGVKSRIFSGAFLTFASASKWKIDFCADKDYVKNGRFCQSIFDATSASEVAFFRRVDGLGRNVVSKETRRAPRIR